MSTQLYPEVISLSDVRAYYSLPNYLYIGVEGEAGVGASADVATPYKVGRYSDVNDLFVQGSPLADLINFILARGVPQVTAVASAKTTPQLSERQAAWDVLASDADVRLRISDTVLQADMEAHADSCGDALLVSNKQVAFGGLAAGSSKATYEAAAAAINSSRFVLVGPGITDEDGNAQDGVFGAAAVMAMVANNPDLSDDLDTAQVLGLTGIEMSGGLPLWTKGVASGVAYNDFEDLLQAGVSPLERGPAGAVQITHLRTTYTTDATMDALMTRLVDDQVYINVRNWLLGGNGRSYLRRGNTTNTREEIRVGVEALLADMSNWIRPKYLPDGKVGYGVSVTSSTDGRQLTVGYKGTIVRGIQTIVVDQQLEVPV